MHTALSDPEYDKLVWRPDAFGSVCFLISGVIAYRASERRGWLPKREGSGWWEAGVNLLGLALAREGEPHGIRVHTIAPAAVETGMFRSLMSKEQYGEDKTLPPAEIARIVAQCITGELAGTSGEVIHVHKRLT